MWIKERFVGLDESVVETPLHNVTYYTSVRALFESAMREHGRCIRKHTTRYYSHVWTFHRSDLGTTIVSVRR